MIRFLRKNYALVIQGGMLTLGMALVFIKTGLIITNSDSLSKPFYLFVNALGLGLCWAVVSFLIDQSSFYKVFGIIGLLLTAVLTDRYMEIPDNPIAISLIILFWVVVTHLVVPTFFEKYKTAILSVYGGILSYFLIFRMMPNYVEDYRPYFLHALLVPIPVFIGLWFYEQWRWLKTLKTEKAKAELTLLKIQVNPHFLFNTLNNLYGLVVEKSPQAPQVVLRLSDMMRYTIYEGKEDWVRLGDEIRYLETYIELHRIRYQKKVDIQFTHEVDEEIRVAPLLFIILLENAFKHGVESLTEEAYIHLNLQTQTNQLLFSITNNYASRGADQKAGIGLENLKKRLAHIYPNRHALKIEKSGDTYTGHLHLLLHSHNRSNDHLLYY